MRKSLQLADEINEFIGLCDVEFMIGFLSKILPLLDLYNVDEDNDWVKDLVGEEDLRNVRVARTAYLMSEIADQFAGRLCRMKAAHEGLAKRMEKQGVA